MQSESAGTGSRPDRLAAPARLGARPWAVLRLGSMRPNAVTYGVVAGLLAVAVEIFLGVRPPAAYGICMACHTRDVVNWILNHVAGTRWEVAPVSASVPLLTTFGVLIGAFVAARRHHEYRPVSLGHGARSLILGVLVVNAAIIAVGCPTRLLLLSAYGEPLGLVGVAGLVAGIVAGTLLLKKGIVS